MVSPERKDALLEAALAVIRRDGPLVSMDAMAAEAGITKPILYRHFGDRDGLLAAVANRFADGLITRLVEALSVQGTPSSRIGRAVRAYVEFIEDDPQLYAFLTEKVQVSSLVGSGIIERVAELLKTEIAETMDFLGIDSEPAETWAYGIVGMMHLAGAHYASSPDMEHEKFISDLLLLTAGGLHGNVVLPETLEPL